MAIITTYPDDSATTDDDKFLTSDSSGATKLTPASIVKAYILDADSVGTTQIVDASVTNAKLSTADGEPGGAWQDWTPTWTNVSGGTTTYAKYIQIGKTVHYRLKYTMAGANISGSASFTIPVAAFSDASNSASKTPVGTAVYYDTNGGWIRGIAYLSSSTTVATLTTESVSSTYPSLATVTATVPFTWASGDTINVSGSYEAA